MNVQADSAASAVSIKLSYKFQRLREQIRQSILHGELHGQMPGERELGKRFHANAKTINKALCDLAGDGLVKRYIGRGTFVTYAPANHVVLPQGRIVYWLSTGAGPKSSDLQTQLASNLQDRGDRLESSPARAAPDGRLDVEHGFFRVDHRVDAVVIAASAPLSRPAENRPSDDLLLALARRQIPTVLVGSVCDTMKRHAVLPDYVGAGFRLAEHLFDAGCRDVIAAAISDDGPEIRAVLHGYESSCRRRHRPHSFANLATGSPGALPPTNGRSNDTIGILCVGGAALETVSDLIRDRRARPPLAAVLEPNDDSGRRYDITTYDFDAHRLVDWAARLVVECGRGTPPIEVLVPGSIHCRSVNPAVVQRDTLAEAVV